MDNHKLDQFLKRIDLEADSVNAGHLAYKRSEQSKNFSNQYLENNIGTFDLLEDIEMITANESIEDDRSTFDEANFNTIDL